MVTARRVLQPPLIVLGVGGLVRVLRALRVAMAVVGLLRFGLTLVVFSLLLPLLFARRRGRRLQAVDDDPSGQECEDRQAATRIAPARPMRLKKFLTTSPILNVSAQRKGHRKPALS